ncbi:MAG: hypothetical protein DELT_02607 [Desulfovibrio sp.]
MELASLITPGRRFLAFVEAFIKRGAEQDLSKRLREIGCNDQSALMQYMFVATRWQHKLEAALSNADGKLNSDVEKIFIDYRKHLHQGLRTAILDHVYLAQTLFSATNGRTRFPMPRCGVKTIIGQQIENAEIVSLWGTLGYEGRRYNLTGNSVAYHVFFNSQNVCVVNDIPAKILEENQVSRQPRYENVRIDLDAARRYATAPLKTRLRRWFLTSYDEDWGACWKEDEPGKPVAAGTTYKSTLVVPISLNFERLDPENREDFEKQWSMCNPMFLQNKDIQIPGHDISANLACLGYFCVDTHVIGYFDEKLDEELGYFIADLLYFYFLTYHMHTRLSPLYNRYCELKGI